MEKSMRQAEKLVQATNSALAQMKLSLMFDAVGREKSCRKGEGLESRLRYRAVGGEEDLRQCQEEFRSEANEMLAKMEKMLGPSDVNRRNARAVDRIKEINRKMNVLKQERGRTEETEQSREKPVRVVGEERRSPEKSSSRGSVGAKGGGPGKRERVPSATQSPAKSKEELRSNILETQEIVDRGFQTARHLAQKVESMRRGERRERREKTLSVEKGVSEVKVGERLVGRRSEGNEVEKSLEEGWGEEGEGEGEREREREREREKEKANVGVVEVKRRERERSRGSRLRFQRLPSVDIRGGLQVQRVHELEIGGVGRGGRGGGGEAKTGIHFVSHEQMEKAKKEKVLEVARRENRYWGGEGGEEGKEEMFGRYVECCDCGKVMRVQEKCVDPRSVDEILRKCNFDVFDPRIDEFVEKWGSVEGRKMWKVCEEGDGGREEGEKKEVKKGEEREGRKEGRRGLSVEGLSNHVRSRYREEVEALEGNHVRVDSLLRSLLRKIEESREVLEECHLLRNEGVGCGKRLRATKAVVVSLGGKCLRSRRKQKQLEKKDVKNRSKRKSAKSPEGKGDKREMRKSGQKGMGDEGIGGGREDEEGMMGRGGRGERGELGREGAEEEEGWSTGWSYSDKSWSDRAAEAVREKGKGVEVGVGERVGESEEMGRQRLVVSPVGKSNSVKLREAKEEKKATTPSSLGSEKGVEEVVYAASKSSSPMKKSETGVLLQKEEMEGAVSEISSERSEENYESDFESSTNEVEDGGEEREEPEPEVFSSGKKLSTISEVDSELERKLSDEQKSQRGSVRSDAELDRSKGSEESGAWKQQRLGLDLRVQKSGSLTSEISNRGRNTEDSPPKTAEASLKSTPTELVTSLKDILSALKDQFARTETLAEKLTENVKQERSERGGVVSGCRMNCEDGLSAGSLSEEGGSSLGEVIVGGERKIWGSEKCESSSGSENGFLKLCERRRSWMSSDRRGEEKMSSRLGMKVDSEELSYSEGEMGSNMFAELECCSGHSVGEVRD